jgi:NTP pyrophosphatase (non-canonical NTP hydrolase)
MANYTELVDSIAQFAAERDWDKFHSPKNLAMALSVEAAELLEHFQWLSEKESSELSVEKLEMVSKEIADVQIYLIRLAERLGVDVLAASASKLEENRLKYPTDRVRGSAKKYTEYDEESGSDS